MVQFEYGFKVLSNVRPYSGLFFIVAGQEKSVF